MDKPFNDNIKKNYFQLFKSGDRKNSSTPKSKNKLKNMKSGLHLFLKMHIACQAASGHMNSFFEHENHYWQLSFSPKQFNAFWRKIGLIEMFGNSNLTSRGSTYSGGKNI